MPDTVFRTDAAPAKREPASLPGRAWLLIKESVFAFLDDGAVSRGAAIAYYTVTSLAPVLIIVIAIAGLVFGQDAARGALSEQIRDLMGQDSAALMERMILSASDRSSGVLANIVGIATLVVTASGVFSEMQAALNSIWRAHPHGTTVSRLVRARIAGLGLVGALGFLLLASLVISAALSGLSTMIEAMLPLGTLLLEALNVVVSFALITVMFAAIYKVLPDRRLTWRDVKIGAAVTAVLFMIGKTLIGLYLGSSNMASSYGAAGGLLILLVWVYYSAQIFLLGAEFTKAYASRYGSFRGTDVATSVQQAAGR
jgi:membrane protein